MRGRIKWFSHEKGYGFLIGEDTVDRYFNIDEVLQPCPLTKNFSVKFDHYDGVKGPAAKRVTAAEYVGRSDRVQCKRCKKEIVPRVITGRPLFGPRYGWTPVVKKSICPFCGSDYKVFPVSKIIFVVFSLAVFVILMLFRFG